MTGGVLRAYAAALAAYMALDLTWLGFVAAGFYRAQFGALMRPDVRWPAAIVFYVIYVAAVVGLCVLPAIERRSLTVALANGALLGLAAYACFDLVGLALIRDFPVRAALVDLAWGVVATMLVAAAGYAARA